MSVGSPPGDYEPPTLHSVLGRITTDGVVDARRMRIGPQALDRILRTVPRGGGDRPVLLNARFDGATFVGNADFAGAIFDGPACFDDAAFTRDARFARASFSGEAMFRRANFNGRAAFGRAEFEGDALFGEALFKDQAVFQRTTFTQNAWFGMARFERAPNFGPVLVLGRLTLSFATFLQPIKIEVSADALVCARTKFDAAANLQIRWAEVALDEAEFAHGSLVATAAEFGGLDETELALICHGGAEPVSPGVPRRHSRDRRRGETARVLSLRRAHLENLVLYGVDLRACRFVGAHNLDRLRLEGAVAFAGTPRTGRWTQRDAIAEEQQLRATAPSSASIASSRIARIAARLRNRRAVRSASGWYPPECQPPEWLAEPDGRPTGVPAPEQLDPRQIAGIYRDLRKGREDHKDEAGAADFYYGEMEMRRARTDAAPAERGIIWLYWLTSGYGLRATRALLALVASVLVFALLFDRWGFDPDRSFGRALLFSAESTSSLFRVPDLGETRLRAGGEALQLLLRLVGPLFFGLALLSVRGRVKR